MTEPKITFVACECHTEGVEVSWWPDDGDGESVYLSMWELKHYQGRKMPWKQRLRSMWHIAKYGEPFKDQVSLSHYDAERVARALRGKMS